MPHNTATKNQAKTPKGPILSNVEYFRAKLSFEMGPYALKELMDDKTNETLFVVDVRSSDQFAEGHIPGSVNIPLQELVGKLSTIPKDKTVVTYCGSLTCQMSVKAALELAQKDYKVVELHGGIKEWTGMGFPVEKA